VPSEVIKIGYEGFRIVKLVKTSRNRFMYAYSSGEVYFRGDGEIGKTLKDFFPELALQFK
jgi:hypothetical protein